MTLKKTSEIDRHIGQRLRLQRVNLGMSQEALGERVNLTFQQIQKYEKGTNRISAARLFEFADILNVDIGFFYEGLGRLKKPTSTKYGAMQEGVDIAEFMDFISSHEGLTLNRNFYKIRNKNVRESIVNMTKSLGKAQPRRISAARQKPRIKTRQK